MIDALMAVNPWSIIGTVGSAYALYAGSCIVRDWLRERTKKREQEQIRPAAQLIIDLINTRRDWEIDQYTWFHPSGVSIWVANGRSSLRANINALNKDDWLRDPPRLTQKALDLNKAERMAMWSALIAQPDHDHTDAVAALAKRIADMYDAPAHD